MWNINDFAILRWKGSGRLEIVIHSDSDVEEMKIDIYCRKLTPELEKVIAVLKMLEQKLTGMYQGETCFIDPDKVLYIDTTDKKTFIYTADRVYETALKLYTLEEELSCVGFFRGGKSIIINLRHIESLKTDLNRRIQVTLDNGEKLLVSRQYAEELKRRLGVK